MHNHGSMSQIEDYVEHKLRENDLHSKFRIYTYDQGLETILEIKYFNNGQEYVGSADMSRSSQPISDIVDECVLEIYEQVYDNTLQLGEHHIEVGGHQISCKKCDHVYTAADGTVLRYWLGVLAETSCD